MAYPGRRAFLIHEVNGLPTLEKRGHKKVSCGLEQKVGAPLMVSSTTVSRFCLHTSSDGEHALLFTSFLPGASLKLRRRQLHYPWSRPPVYGRQSPGLCLSCVASFILRVKHTRAHAHSNVVCGSTLGASGYLLGNSEQTGQSLIFQIFHHPPCHLKTHTPVFQISNLDLWCPTLNPLFLS